MKLIDIFNKIANDEPVPKKVKFNDEIYTYKPEWKDYADEDEHYGLFVDTISNTYQITKMLNEEIEIIEEDKKIEKLDCVNKKDGYSTIDFDMVQDKINELIDEVNKLKGDKDANR
jgi:hypothetical protein